MAVAVYFKIHAEILYGPELLSTFNGNRIYISSSVQ